MEIRFIYLENDLVWDENSNQKMEIAQLKKMGGIHLQYRTIFNPEMIKEYIHQTIEEYLAIAHDQEYPPSGTIS